MNSFLNQDDNTTNDAVDNEYLFVEAPFSENIPLHSGLHDFEQTLRCTICHEFFHVPVSLVECHHTFCSGCIRDFIKSSKKGMKRCADCPICRVRVPDGDESKSLIPNRTIETLLRQYKALRSDLSVSLSTSSTTTTDASGEEDVKQPAKEESETTEEEPATRRRTTRSSDASASTSMATMPTGTRQPPQVQQRLVRKTTTHYNALKHKDLVKLCSDARLSTKGSDEKLRARHEDYVQLYNSQCDSYHPMSELQMARVIMEREEKIKKESKKRTAHAAALVQLKENCKQMGQDKEARGTASSGNAALDAEMKANFAKMIPPDQLEKRKRKWVDTTPEEVLNGAVAQPENGTTGATSQEVVANQTAPAASMPVNMTAQPATSQEVVANETAQASMPATNVAAPPNNTNVASMPIVNPYSSNKKKKSTNENVPPSFSSSARKPSNTNTTTLPPSTENSSRKPPPRRSLMTNYLAPAASAPTPRKLSLSQQSAASSATASSSFQPWSCGVCTFFNEMKKSSRALCEMCGNPRPGPSEQREVVLLDV